MIVKRAVRLTEDIITESRGVGKKMPGLKVSLEHCNNASIGRTSMLLA